MPGRAWSEIEVRAVVEDYFSMLSKEIRGEHYNKSAHRNRILAVLDHRSPGSIERKHENISAVLLEEGLPFIDGYKPLPNYQQLLRAVVLERLESAGELLRTINLASEFVPAEGTVRDWADPRREVTPPSPIVRDAKRVDTEAEVRPRRYDYPERDALNRELGRLGELFVYEVERKRLVDANRQDLAQRIEWTSRTKGDGFGYDLRSFDSRGREVFIEVKTTNHGPRLPFIISPNEVRASTALDPYRLYRVFKFKFDPAFFILPGRVEAHAELVPRSYFARLR